MNQNSSCKGKHYLCIPFEFFLYLNGGDLVNTIGNAVCEDKATIGKKDHGNRRKLSCELGRLRM